MSIYRVHVTLRIFTSVLEKIAREVTGDTEGGCWEEVCYDFSLEEQAREFVRRVKMFYGEPNVRARIEAP